MSTFSSHSLGHPKWDHIIKVAKTINSKNEKISKINHWQKDMLGSGHLRQLTKEKKSVVVANSYWNAIYSHGRSHGHATFILTFMHCLRAFSLMSTNYHVYAQTSCQVMASLLALVAFLAYIRWKIFTKMEYGLYNDLKLCVCISLYYNLLSYSYTSHYSVTMSMSDKPTIHFATLHQAQLTFYRKYSIFITTCIVYMV